MHEHQFHRIRFSVLLLSGVVADIAGVLDAGRLQSGRLGAP
jgi:ribose/xylose/arabinose/galactoside ABC-type transport system permease subunit